MKSSRVFKVPVDAHTGVLAEARLKRFKTMSALYAINLNVYYKLGHLNKTIDADNLFREHCSP
jgi:hypothetical protein